jgi:8-oxo-dGTP diphosphatase
MKPEKSSGKYAASSQPLTQNAQHSNLAEERQVILLNRFKTLGEAREEIKRLETELHRTQDLSNGANLVVMDEKERILVVREKTVRSESNIRRWMLPGGGVERGETPRHAAQSETEEETGILTDEADFRLIAFFAQRPKGAVFLYETERFSGEIRIQESEVSEARFMSLQEIIEQQSGFGTGYLRMILRYFRCKYGIDPVPFEGRLSDPVEFPRNLKGGHYQEIVLKV